MEKEQFEYLINPKISDINFTALEEKIKKLTPETEFKTTWNFFKSFEEQNFIKITLTDYDQTQVELATFRIKQKLYDKPKAIIVFQNGLAAPVEQFSHMAYRLAEKGIEAVAFDPRGFGRTKTTYSGYINSYTDLQIDLQLFLDELDKIYDKSIPRFFCGNSMGGMNGLLYSIDNPSYFKGLLLCSPAIVVNPLNSKYSRKLAQCLNFIGFGKFGVTLKPKNMAQRDYQVFLNNLDNPFITRQTRPRTISELLKGMNNLSQILNKVTTNFIAFQSGVDIMVDSKGIFDLIEKAQSKEKKLIFIPHAWHNLLQDPQLPQVVDSMKEWVFSQI